MEKWLDTFEEIYSRHQKYDKKMVEEYLNRGDLAAYDICFLFKPG